MNVCDGEIAVLQKSNGPLTKRIAQRDGKIINNNHSAAWRTALPGIALIAGMHSGFSTLQITHTQNRRLKWRTKKLRNEAQSNRQRLIKNPQSCR